MAAADGGGGALWWRRWLVVLVAANPSHRPVNVAVTHSQSVTIAVCGAGACVRQLRQRADAVCLLRLSGGGAGGARTFRKMPAIVWCGAR